MISSTIAYPRSVIAFVLFLFLGAVLAKSAAADGSPIPVDVDWGPEAGTVVQLHFDAQNNVVNTRKPVHIITRGTGCKALVIITEFHDPAGLGPQIRNAREYGPLTGWRVIDPYLKARGIPGLNTACRRDMPVLARLASVEADVVWYFIGNRSVPRGQFDAYAEDVGAAWPSFAQPLITASQTPPDDRLDLSGDPVAQFVAYAAALGIAEADITEAIFAGRFVPHRDDVLAVLASLQPGTCRRVLATYAKAVDNSYNSLLGFDCMSYLATGSSDAMTAFNTRFGKVSQDRAMLAAQRNYVLLTGNMSEPSWVKQADIGGITAPDAIALADRIRDDYALPFHIVWRDASGGRLDLRGNYDRARAAYLQSLDGSKLVGLGLKADDATFRGTDSTPPPFILTAFYHGNFALLDRMSASRPEGHSRFADQIALWGLIRFEKIGDCGERVATLIHTLTPYTEWYENGMLMDVWEKPSTETEIRVPAHLADPIIAAPETVRAQSDRFIKLAERLGCDSGVRRMMEANMSAYFNGRDPVFSSGL